MIAYVENSRIRQLADCQLVDWTSRRLVNSRTRQLAYWTTRGCHPRLCVLSFPFWRHLRDRELSSPRLDQSARCPVRELAIRDLAYPRVVQLPLETWASDTGVVFIFSQTLT